MRSLQNLNTFVCRTVDDNNNNSNGRCGTLRSTADERRSPYYYNELTNSTRLHAINQQFLPINEGNINDDSFTDFINTIHHPETIS